MKIVSIKKLVEDIIKLEIEYNVRISIDAEEYPNGTNWCWQILWGEDGGTFGYGDSNEHPKIYSAFLAVKEFLEVMKEKGQDEAHKNYVNNLKKYK